MVTRNSPFLSGATRMRCILSADDSLLPLARRDSAGTRETIRECECAQGKLTERETIKVFHRLDPQDEQLEVAAIVVENVVAIAVTLLEQVEQLVADAFDVVVDQIGQAQFG